MKNEQEHLENINRLANKICTLACPDIVAVIREYNAAVDDFRRWARENPCPVPQGKVKECEPKIWHVVWVAEFKVEFIN